MRPISHRVGQSVGRSVGLSHFAFFAFLGILRAGKFVFEHAPAQVMAAPAQIITAPAQIITGPAQPPATEVVVYTALFQLYAVSTSRFREWKFWHFFFNFELRRSKRLSFTLKEFVKVRPSVRWSDGQWVDRSVGPLVRPTENADFEDRK